MDWSYVLAKVWAAAILLLFRDALFPACFFFCISSFHLLSAAACLVAILAAVLWADVSAGCGRLTPTLLRLHSRMRCNSFSFLSSAARIFSFISSKVRSGATFPSLNRGGTLAFGQTVFLSPTGMSKATAACTFRGRVASVELSGWTVWTVLELEELL